jgi:phosphoglycolate phosphatase
MSRFHHLIFDLDGTLVDTKDDLAAATNHMLAVLGLPQLALSQVTSFVGNGARVLVEKALGSDQAHLVDRGFEVFMRYYSAHLLDHTRLYEGMASLLSEARQLGVVLSVLTNKPETPSRAILSGLGLDSLFIDIVGGDTLPVKKPSPQGVLYLHRRTSIALEDTLLIGDSRVDYDTGVAARVAVCGVTWGFGAADFATLTPQFVVNTAEQLRAVILA